MIKFHPEVHYSPQVRRNDTELLILRSNGDVMTASQSLRNVDEAQWALQIVGMQHGKKENHFHTTAKLWTEDIVTRLSAKDAFYDPENTILTSIHVTKLYNEDL